MLKVNAIMTKSSTINNKDSLAVGKKSVVNEKSLSGTRIKRHLNNGGSERLSHTENNKVKTANNHLKRIKIRTNYRLS